MVKRGSGIVYGMFRRVRFIPRAIYIVVCGWKAGNKAIHLLSMGGWTDADV